MSTVTKSMYTNQELSVPEQSQGIFPKCYKYQTAVTKRDGKKSGDPRKQSRSDSSRYRQSDTPTVSEVNKYKKSHFLLQQHFYLDIEKEAEIQKGVKKNLASNKDSSGLIRDLYIKDYQRKNLDRYLIQFESNLSNVLVTNGLKKGDSIFIFYDDPEDNNMAFSGVINYIGSSLIEVYAKDIGFNFDSVFSIVLNSFMDHTLKLIDSIKEISQSESELVEILFGNMKPDSPYDFLPRRLCKPGSSELSFFNNSLDVSQRAAVDFVLKQGDLAVIHGPPGTGKTTTLIEIIQQHVKLGDKILALAPSNLAVDNLVEKLDKAGLKVVRVGHPARVTETTQKHTLDAHLNSPEILKTLNRNKKELENAILSYNVHQGIPKMMVKERIKELKEEDQFAKRNFMNDILKRADVVLGTLSSVQNDHIFGDISYEYFDVTVIDECGQAIEAACYPAVLCSKKLLLAGDHLQLPPTVLANEKAKPLIQSLMERMVDKYGKTVTRTLQTQFRMNEKISNWSSEAMYEDNLKPHKSVKEQILSDLPGVTSNEYTEHPLCLIDTKRCSGFDESIGKSYGIAKSSKVNYGEATLVCGVVEKLISSNVPQKDIGIISPYSMQVKEIKSLLQEEYPDIEVQTVDGFQGREKEVIILSLVRSNQNGEIGFLSEDRRLNVAVTRARRNLTIICDTSTLQHNRFLANFSHYLQRNAHLMKAEDLDEGKCWQLAVNTMLNRTSLTLECPVALKLQKYDSSLLPPCSDLLHMVYYFLLYCLKQDSSYLIKFLKICDCEMLKQYVNNTNLMYNIVNNFCRSNPSHKIYEYCKNIGGLQSRNNSVVEYCRNLDSESCCNFECVIYNILFDKSQMQYNNFEREYSFKSRTVRSRYSRYIPYSKSSNMRKNYR